MRKPILLLAALFSLPLYSQTTLPPVAEKGATPLNPQSTIRNPQSTRAVVVGISDYQHNAIPDLRFAHRDAEALSAWLQSPGGGSLPTENITLLTNGRATTAQVGAALEGLIEQSQPGDLAIIYFSGHGDVETKTMRQNGYLLCHDSPASTYVAGAFPLSYLEDIVSTLSLQNKARVVVITDACHAGKLAGEGIGGAQLTSANLAKQFAGELKILSCQPNEFSLEGEQWGGGRGVFSYHLLDGLTGLADKNADGGVSLFELGRYLEDLVPTEAAPHPQLPMVLGDRQAQLSKVDGAALSALRQARAELASAIAATGSKGSGEQLLEGLDSAAQAQYRSFQSAIERGELLEPVGYCANDFYLQLADNQALASLHGLMRRNLAAALQDEVQQALNALLESDPYETNNWHSNPDKYGKYPEYLQRSMDLLGEKHYMHRTLMAKKRYFEGYLFTRKTVDMSEGEERESLQRIAKGKYLEAAQLEPTAAYIYQAIASLHYFTSPPQTDSLLHWNSIASQWSPKWLQPYLDNAYEVIRTNSDLAGAERWMKLALAADSCAYVVLERLAWLYQWQGKTQASLDLCDRMIALKPDLFNAYSTKGVTHTMRLEFKEAEELFNRSLKLDSTYGNWAYHFMAKNFAMTRRLPQSYQWVQKIWDDPSANIFVKAQAVSYLVISCAITRQDFDSGFWSNRVLELQLSPVIDALTYMGYGMSMVQAGKLEEGRQLLVKSLETNLEPDGHQVLSRVYLGVIEAKNGNTSLADSIFKDAFRHISPNALDNHITLMEGYYQYGDFLLRQRRYDEARRQFRLAEEHQPRCYQAQYGHALLAAASGRKWEALDYMEQALVYWYPIAKPIKEEPLFKKIRRTKRFKALMRKHFPEKGKG